MSKAFKTILIISIIVFGGSFLLINSAQAGVIQFVNKQIFVDFNGLPFNLNNFAPGMSDVKSIIIKNNENFDINVYFGAKKTSGDDVLANLADVLTITIGDKSNHLSDLFNNNIALTPINSGKSQNYNIALSFDEDAGNEYQGKTINFDFIITAEQIGKGNGEIPPVVIPGGGGGRALLTIQEGSVRIPEIGETSVTITWLTPYSSTSQVIYAAAGETYSFDLTKTNYGYPHAVPVPEDSTKVTFHSVTITGLTPGTTYYYRCVSYGSLAISREYSFTTKGVAGEAVEEKEEEGPVVPPEEEAERPEVAGEVVEEAPAEEEFQPEIILPGEKEEPVTKKVISRITAFPGDLASMLVANLGMAWEEISQSTLKTLGVVFLLAVLVGILGKEVWIQIRKKRRK